MKLLYRVFLWISLLLDVGCQHSSPTDSTLKNGNAAKGYNLYIGNWGYDEVFVVDTDSNAVVDTLRGFGSVWDLAVSSSGAKLYVSTRQGPINFPGNLYTVDFRTKRLDMIYSKVVDVYLAPQGTIFIISKDPFQLPRSIGIIDTISNAITFFDTLDIRDTGNNSQSVVFDRTRSLLYAVNNDKRLFVYDYDKKEIVRVYQNLFDPLHMVISPNGRFLYVAGGPVFDLERDSVIARVGGNILGSLALSPDGEYLYVTDPGKYIIFDPPPIGKVRIFHTNTNRYGGDIDVNRASGHIDTITDRIVIMPDGETAYVTDSIANLFVIDFTRREVKDIVKFIPRNISIRPVVLGLQMIK